MMMRNNVNEGLATSELYNNNLCLLCEAIELQQNTNNNNICSDKNKRLDNKNNNTLINSTTNSIKKKHIYKRKKPVFLKDVLQGLSAAVFTDYFHMIFNLMMIKNGTSNKRSENGIQQNLTGSN